MKLQVVLLKEYQLGHLRANSLYWQQQMTFDEVTNYFKGLDGLILRSYKFF